MTSASMARMPIRKSLIHGIARCTVCSWTSENYRSVQGLAHKHAKTTGHLVCAELGYLVEYRGVLRG
jgi:hypothetical protein